MTVVTGEKGGGFVCEVDSRTLGLSKEEPSPTSQANLGLKMLKGIPITLKRLDGEGSYVLTADDK